MVPGARRDGVQAGTAPPKEAEEVLVESAPVLADALEVERMGGGATEASPADTAMAQTSEPELPTSSAIGGSVPEGVLLTEEVLSAPIGPTPRLG